MTPGPSYGNYLLRTDRVPGEEPLPYVKAGRKTFIATSVMIFHAALVIVPMIFLAISEMVRPPVYVMRLPTVESVPNENPEPSPHPSPLQKKSTGVPDKGPPSEIPEIPDLVKPVEVPEPVPPAPAPKPLPKEVPTPKTVKPKPVPDSKKTAPAKVKPQKQPKKTLLSAKDIKISHKRVKNPVRNSSSAQQNRMAAERARNARNQQLAKQLRSLSGEIGGTGIPGGGGGPKGIVSKEVNDYYYKVEAFLKRRWEQPSIFGHDRPKVIILFQVAADGRVLSARIQERSGNAAMDASVEQLLRGLQTLPAPPRTMEFTVTMEIDR